MSEKIKHVNKVWSGHIMRTERSDWEEAVLIFSGNPGDQSCAVITMSDSKYFAPGEFHKFTENTAAYYLKF